MKWGNIFILPVCYITKEKRIRLWYRYTEVFNYNGITVTRADSFFLCNAYVTQYVCRWKSVPQYLPFFKKFSWVPKMQKNFQSRTPVFQFNLPLQHIKVLWNKTRTPVTYREKRYSMTGNDCIPLQNLQEKEIVYIQTYTCTNNERNCVSFFIKFIPGTFL